MHFFYYYFSERNSLNERAEDIFKGGCWQLLYGGLFWYFAFHFHNLTEVEVFFLKFFFYPFFISGSIDMIIGSALAYNNMAPILAAPIPNLEVEGAPNQEAAEAEGVGFIPPSNN